MRHCVLAAYSFLGKIYVLPTCVVWRQGSFRPGVTSHHARSRSWHLAYCVCLPSVLCSGPEANGDRKCLAPDISSWCQHARKWAGMREGKGRWRMRGKTKRMYMSAQTKYAKTWRGVEREMNLGQQLLFTCGLSVSSHTLQSRVIWRVGISVTYKCKTH